MGKKTTEEAPQDDAQDLSPEDESSESQPAAQPIQRSAMDDPSHPLHHLRNA